MLGHAGIWAKPDDRPDVDGPLRATWRTFYQARPWQRPTIGDGPDQEIKAPDWWYDDDTAPGFEVT